MLLRKTRSASSASLSVGVLRQQNAWLGLLSFFAGGDTGKL
ncbi:hypothetical protein RISK_006054 [Rhodopirellula islandica]|uniref:Uncharacterized protein n=1 Tax=Rhodopirellula islandica TaxID=595434 RepID=A0A0J1B4V4_RHOIS|nr:hypothetical protein RISK_006054 [Rhodopirellula islandica]